jgi:putative hemolysin
MTLVLVLFAVGLGLSAFFSGTETGFYRATRVRLAVEALSGDQISRALLWLVNQPSLFVATVLVGNNIANHLVSFSVVMASQLLFPAGGTWVNILSPIAVAPLLFVCGELLPKNLFYDAPNRLLKRCAPPLFLVTVLFAPITIVLWVLGRLMQVLAKTTPQQVRLTLARRELAELITEGHEAGILRPVQQSLAQAMLAVAGQPVKSFALPAGRAVRVTTTMSKSDVLRIAQRHRRTLLPVEDPQQKRQLVGYLRMVDLYLDDSSELPEPKPLVTLRDNQSYLSALRMLSHIDDPLGHVVTGDGRTVGFVTGRDLRLALLKAQ